ncbi:hypothetical protein PspLS_07745 [Pyricularia sp. CBS 133598]|nr:hypothetical protein PspLS_07745 [Pyricularia sp. CBS 133598]
MDPVKSLYSQDLHVGLTIARSPPPGWRLPDANAWGPRKSAAGLLYASLYGSGIPDTHAVPTRRNIS